MFRRFGIGPLTSTGNSMIARYLQSRYGFLLVSKTTFSVYPDRDLLLTEVKHDSKDPLHYSSGIHNILVAHMFKDTGKRGNTVYIKYDPYNVLSMYNDLDKLLKGSHAWQKEYV